MKRLSAFVLPLLLVLPTALAGDRELDVVLVNMTPDEQSDDASRQCASTVRRAARADYTLISGMGETALRERAGDASGAFMAWQEETLRAVREGHDALVLFDCRPRERSIDAWVYSASGVSRLTLRGVPLTTARVQSFTERILRSGWLGFVP